MLQNLDHNPVLASRSFRVVPTFVLPFSRGSAVYIGSLRGPTLAPRFRDPLTYCGKRDRTLPCRVSVLKWGFVVDQLASSSLQVPKTMIFLAALLIVAVIGSFLLYSILAHIARLHADANTNLIGVVRKHRKKGAADSTILDPGTYGGR